MTSNAQARPIRSALQDTKLESGFRWREVVWPVVVAACTVVASVATAVARPAASPIGLGALLLVLVYLVMLPQLKFRTGLLVATGLAAAFVAAGWIQGQLLVVPLLALFVGHYTFLLGRIFAREGAAAGKGAAHATPLQVALSLQAEGKLDEAFVMLAKLPARREVLRALYHLGKAFEREKSFVRAREVFARVVANAPLYRDAAARLKRAERLAEVETHAKGLSPAGLQDDRMLVMPEHLGRYEIEGELGRGSMGTVFAAKDPVIGRMVALKTLALSSEFEGAALVDARARFFREAESAGRLQHPQIVAIFDAGEEHGLSWIAMERLRGRDLGHATRPGELLAVSVVLSIAARVADALDYAHRHQVVHRDIKPSNILYEPETDGVKVTDFGIARITDNSKTRTGLVLGTPSFMAPEQIMGTRVDGRCDIYALGVTLYQLLTGSLPLRGESMSALMQAIAHQVPSDMRTLRPELPDSLAILVARALEKDPQARFQTGAQMARALREVDSGEAASIATRFGSALDYDAHTDLHDQPMADYPDTVLDSAAAHQRRSAGRSSSE